MKAIGIGTSPVFLSYKKVLEPIEFLVTVYLEGLYVGGDPKMNYVAATDPETGDPIGPYFGEDIADLITIELHHTSDYKRIVQTFENVVLDTNGYATFSVRPRGTFYLTIKTRNHLEVTSAAPINFGTTTSYNFTYDIQQAYGDNLKKIDSNLYVLYAGDIDQDGIIDTDDEDIWTSALGQSTFHPADLNGDGNILLADYTLWAANAGTPHFKHIPHYKLAQCKVYLEGYYNVANQNMNVVQNIDEQTRISTPRFSNKISDLITIELHDTNDYTKIVQTIPNVKLHSNGIVKFFAKDTGTYYLTIKTRHHIETVSAIPINFSDDIDYDFTTSADKAYGDNQKEVERGVFALYGGDVNQDGVIDQADLDAYTLVFGTRGYLPEDVDGDGAAFSTDWDIIVGNSAKTKLTP